MLNGHINKTKYAYNSGKMMQAAILLYRITRDSVYLQEAEKTAEACYRYFFFHKSQYIDTFRMTLDKAWNNARETNDLFNCDYIEKVKDKKR